MEKFLSSIKNGLKSIMSSPDGGNDTGLGAKNNKAAKNSRQHLLNLIVAEFENSIEMQSTDMGLAFNGFFKVYIYNSHFNFYESTFQLTVGEAMVKFCRIINKRRTAYGSSFKMPLNYCRFELIRMPDPQTDGTGNTNDEIGFVGSFFTDPKDVVSSDPETSGRSTEHVMTVINRSGQVVNRAVNMAVLSSVKALNRNRFEVKFNLNDPQAQLQEVEKAGKSAAAAQAMAEKTSEQAPAAPKGLSLTAKNFDFISGAANGRIFNMTSPRLRVAGRNHAAASDDAPVLRCDSDEVMNYHFEIKDLNGSYFLTPVGKMTLNGRELQSGKNYQIKDGAKLVLAGKYEIVCSL